MNIFIPIISAILFWLGGRDQMKVPINQKGFRWWILPGFLALVCLISTHSWLMALLSLSAYIGSLWGLSYGENWLRKLVGKDIQWILYGFCFGLSSFFCLSWLSLLQSLIGAGSTWFLLKWSNDGFKWSSFKLNHEYVEIGIGLSATILYLFL